MESDGNIERHRSMYLRIAYGRTEVVRPTAILVDDVPISAQLEYLFGWRGSAFEATLTTFDGPHELTIEFDDGTHLSTLVADEPAGGPNGQTSTPPDVIVDLSKGMESASITARLNYKNWGEP